MYFRIEDIVRAFWRGYGARGRASLRSTGRKLYSGRTVILQRLSDGRTIANLTSYNSTTYRHQKAAELHRAHIKLADVPEGAEDLSIYI